MLKVSISVKILEDGPIDTIFVCANFVKSGRLGLVASERGPRGGRCTKNVFKHEFVLRASVSWNDRCHY